MARKARPRMSPAAASATILVLFLYLILLMFAPATASSAPAAAPALSARIGPPPLAGTPPIPRQWTEGAGARLTRALP